MHKKQPHLRPSLKHLLSLSLAAVLCSSSVLAGPLYRWVDENGKVHYGDSIPSQYVQKGYKVVSEQGITVFTIKPASEIPAPKKEEKQEPKPLSTYERGLLATYINEEEVEQAKANKLADIDTIIQLTLENITLLETQFRQLTKSAGDYERRGKEVPTSLRQDINTTQEKITDLFRTIERYKTQRKEEALRFDQDLKRFNELKQRGL